MKFQAHRRFAPGKTGEASALGSLESTVMEVVWARQQDVTVAEVHEGLPKSSQGAYTTVKTTMDRLADKGILVRERYGKGCVYRASITQAELERRIVSQALDRLVEQFPTAIASFFVEPEPDVDAERLALLKVAIERRRKGEE